MSRTYALQMLLEHGPLTRKEIREITGWRSKAVIQTISQLVEWGSIVEQDGIYSLWSA